MQRRPTRLFAIPAAALNRVARFRIAGSPSAGAVWLWDDTARRPHVGLADTRDEAQPLLSEHYYARKALQPYAQLTEKKLSDLLDSPIDAIIMGDRGNIDEATATRLTEWMEKGGVLIRFAGPRLAAQEGPLSPVTLRPTSRALGSAMSWETPQRIAEFPASSPFVGIPRPADVAVRQQVLAQPSAELDSLTWARLEDGTPLVTARRVGQGQIILFHVTADPDWSDLPFTGRICGDAASLGGIRRTAFASACAWRGRHPVAFARARRIWRADAARLHCHADCSSRICEYTPGTDHAAGALSRAGRGARAQRRQPCPARI